MTLMTMTIGDLCVSPFNARTNKRDANAIDGMAQSLLKRGQLYPLVVHPMPRKGEEKQIWGAFIGGRRLRSFQKLIEQGDLPADHPIEVITREGISEGELLELSVHENAVRLDLRSYEVYAAIFRAHGRGRTIAEIAETNGQTHETIKQWIRLGGLEQTVFAALEEGEITQEQAKAFGATEDQAMQRWAFDTFRKLPSHSYQRAPAEIRKLLRVGDSEQRKLLRFLGEKAYRDAGGRYELDLFAEAQDDRGRVTDEGLLMDLVEQKMAGIRDRLRAQSGRDLRFEPEYPRDGLHGPVFTDIEITPTWSAEPADAERLIFLEHEMIEMEGSARQLLEHPESPERAAAIEALELAYAPLEEEVAQLDARRSLQLPAGDIFGTLMIEPDGQLETRWWWASRKAMVATQKKDGTAPRLVSTGPIGKVAPSSSVDRQPVAGSAALDRTGDWTAQQRADAFIREEQGLSQDGVQAMRSMRRMALRAALIIDSRSGVGCGVDYLVWSLARDQFGNGYARDRGIQGLTSSPEPVPQSASDHAERTPAFGIWKSAVDSIKAHPSIVGTDLPAAFRAYEAEPPIWKDLVAALVTGAALMRSANAEGYRVPLHDELATQCGYATDEQLRQLIEPTEELVEMLPRAQRLAVAEPHVDDATFRSWGKLKAKELVAPVTRALRHAAAFVHPMLRFEPSSNLVDRELEEVGCG